VATVALDESLAVQILPALSGLTPGHVFNFKQFGSIGPPCNLELVIRVI
jgi:hypothetical protein